MKIMATKSYFLPTRRDPEHKVLSRYKQMVTGEYLVEMLNAMPDIAAILNENRQIVFANQSLLHYIKAMDLYHLLGKRPGEVLHCINANQVTGGCGASPRCQYCGAIKAILESQKTKGKVIRECRMRVTNGEEEDYLDLRVTASHFMFKNHPHTILSIKDISDEKRRLILERIFFHDILNIAGSIKAFSEVLKTLQPDTSLKKDTELQECFDIMTKLSNELLEEIFAQRTLASAENGDLKPEIRPVSITTIFEEVVSYLSLFAISDAKQIRINPSIENAIVNADNSLVKRVVINLVKNALEATENGESVTLNSKIADNKVIIIVHNGMAMDNEVQAQIFQRSFSTKGNDRGIGTYSIKLLTERYLKGKVYFESNEEKGTTFFVELPGE